MDCRIIIWPFAVNKEPPSRIAPNSATWQQLGWVGDWVGAYALRNSEFPQSGASALGCHVVVGQRSWGVALRTAKLGECSRRRAEHTRRKAVHVSLSSLSPADMTAHWASSSKPTTVFCASHLYLSRSPSILISQCASSRCRVARRSVVPLRVCLFQPSLNLLTYIQHQSPVCCQSFCSSFVCKHSVCVSCDTTFNLLSKPSHPVF